MKKVVRLTETELTRLVNKIIMETKTEKVTLSDYYDDIYDKLMKRFDLTSKEVFQILDYYRDDIEMGFQDGDSINSVINSWVKDGKLKWKA